jgi:hypothetical protein
MNWEKFHFMVREGIVLGHRISHKGRKVDQAKIEVIEKKKKIPLLLMRKALEVF